MESLFVHRNAEPRRARAGLVLIRRSKCLPRNIYSSLGGGFVIHASLFWMDRTRPAIERHKQRSIQSKTCISPADGVTERVPKALESDSRLLFLFCTLCSLFTLRRPQLDVARCFLRNQLLSGRLSSSACSPRVYFFRLFSFRRFLLFLSEFPM